MSWFISRSWCCPGTRKQISKSENVSKCLILDSGSHDFRRRFHIFQFELPKPTARTRNIDFGIFWFLCVLMAHGSRGSWVVRRLVTHGSLRWGFYTNERLPHKHGRFTQKLFLVYIKAFPCLYQSFFFRLYRSLSLFMSKPFLRL